MTEFNRLLKVFLCHASADKPAVRTLYKRLIADGVEAWLDETNLMPGQNWRDEISSAVQDADVVIICLSNHSTNKEGFIQKEIRLALEVADEKPEETIYIIPAKLEECQVPRQLKYWQWVNIFFDGETFVKEEYDRLLQSLRLRALKIGAKPPFTQENQILAYLPVRINSENSKRKEPATGYYETSEYPKDTIIRFLIFNLVALGIELSILIGVYLVTQAQITMLGR